MLDYERFLHNSDNRPTHYFKSPTCQMLEGRYMQIFAKSVRLETEDGVEFYADGLVIAKTGSLLVKRMDEILPGHENFYASAVVKNPFDTMRVRVNHGEKNAIFMHQQTGIVFAGKVTDIFTIEAVRPIVGGLQRSFQTKLESLSVNKADYPR